MNRVTVIQSLENLLRDEVRAHLAEMVLQDHPEFKT